MVTSSYRNHLVQRKECGCLECRDGHIIVCHYNNWHVDHIAKGAEILNKKFDQFSD